MNAKSRHGALFCQQNHPWKNSKITSQHIHDHENFVKMWLWKNSKVLTPLEGCQDLTMSPSLSVKIVGGNYTQKSGVQIRGSNPRSGRSNPFCPFSVHFQILHIKLNSMSKQSINSLFYKSDINKNICFQNVLFDF